MVNQKNSRTIAHRSTGQIIDWSNNGYWIIHFETLFYWKLLYL